MTIERPTITDILSRVINIVFSLIIIGLGFRFLLRLLGANPDADFARFIYESTSPLLEPFRGLFTSQATGDGSIFEFTTLFAIMVYLLVMYLISEALAYITYRSSSTYRSR